MKRYILTVTLNPAVDKTVYVPDFRIGKDFRETQLHLSAGGKGLNVSRTLKHLGHRALATGFIGGGSGSYIGRQLDKEKIKHRFTPIEGNTRTSLTIIDSQTKKITRVLERGPKISPRELKAFKKAFTSHLSRASFVLFCGRNIPGAGDSIYAGLIAIAKKRGVKTLLDTSGKALILGLKKKPFMVKPNLQEAEHVVRKKLKSFSDIKKALRHFHNLGIEVVAITMGSKGAVVSDKNEVIFARPPEITRKNPVGCGDAFLAGFVLSVVRKKSLKESLTLGVACGAANAASISPGFIKRESLGGIIKKIQLKRINSCV
ncbi:MAG: 1-phosphofructokinase family hexose kinase [Candidatus Omnitrophota bacterium]|nr:MAG: 1-phosphofructokinase family hexose kinase [Candidatus Omnitrophota bacterium]